MREICTSGSVGGSERAPMITAKRARRRKRRIQPSDDLPGPSRLPTRQLGGDVANSPAPPPRPAAPVRQRDEAEPLTAELRRYHITVSKRFLAKHDRKKGLVKKPRTAPPRPSERPRHIPAEVKRAVWTRDRDRCQWPVTSGGVCGSTRQLELDHIVPVARGGASTAANLRVTCRQHNQLAARQAFGAWMDQFTSRPSPGPAQGPSPCSAARCDGS